MEPAAKKPVSARNLLVRAVLFLLFVFLLRFVYVVTIFGGSCTAGDFCILSSPAAALFAYSRTNQRQGALYSAMFQDLLSEGFLSPASKSLCVDDPVGYEVLALRGVGVADAVGVAQRSTPPLVVAGGDPLRLPFKNGTFEFVFAGRSLDWNNQPRHLAAEIERTLRQHSFLVVLTASAGDAYSLHSLADLFPSCITVRFRDISSPDSSPLREIIFQKQEGSENLKPKLHSDTKCPTPEHKLRVLQSAEPLIEEEPLKPWISLKRNIKNVKYLPSMADISFKQRYIYIDVGARSYGSSIGSWFKKQYPKQNHTFEIFAVEADRAFHAEYVGKKGVNLLPFAAWTRNETLTFEINHDPGGGSQEGRGMGRIRPSVGGSDSGELQSIQGFDFAAWLMGAAEERDYVVVKMDVEGAEFELVPRLLDTGAICLVDELLLECHYNRWQRCCPGERSPKYKNTYGECLKLFASIRESGVLVHQWW